MLTSKAISKRDFSFFLGGSLELGSAGGSSAVACIGLNISVIGVARAAFFLSRALRRRRLGSMLVKKRLDNGRILAGRKELGPSLKVRRPSKDFRELRYDFPTTLPLTSRFLPKRWGHRR